MKSNGMFLKDNKIYKTGSSEVIQMHFLLHIPIYSSLIPGFTYGSIVFHPVPVAC